jgi:hypothetical protein
VDSGEAKLLGSRDVVGGVINEDRPANVQVAPTSTGCGGADLNSTLTFRNSIGSRRAAHEVIRVTDMMCRFFGEVCVLDAAPTPIVRSAISGSSAPRLGYCSQPRAL